MLKVTHENNSFNITFPSNYCEDEVDNALFMQCVSADTMHAHRAYTVYKRKVYLTISEDYARFVVLQTLGHVEDEVKALSVCNAYKQLLKRK